MENRDRRMKWVCQAYRLSILPIDSASLLQSSFLNLLSSSLSPPLWRIKVNDFALLDWCLSGLYFGVRTLNHIDARASDLFPCSLARLFKGAESVLSSLIGRNVLPHFKARFTDDSLNGTAAFRALGQGILRNWLQPLKPVVTVRTALSLAGTVLIDRHLSGIIRLT